MADERLQPLPFDNIVQLMVDSFLTSQDDTEHEPTADDVMEGSVALAIFEGVADPLEFLMYQMAVDLPARFFLNQATGSALDRLVENFTFGQVVRVAARSGAGVVVYEAAPGTPIPQSHQLRAPNGVLVSTLFPGAVAVGDTKVELGAAALSTGANTNLVALTELVPVTPIPGVTRVYVKETWTGGADQQSDDSLRAAVIEFIDSMAKGVRPAVILGARQSGYDRVVLVEPGPGRLWLFVDDGNPPSLAKLDACRVSVHRSWKAAGAKLLVSPYAVKPYTIKARAFSDGTVTLDDLEAAIAAKWIALDSTLRMGQGLDRLDDLIAAASTVPGYNGVNLETPAVDLTVAAATNEYWSEFGEGYLRPYEKLQLAGIEWVR